MKKTLRKDSEWATIDGEICKVIEFNPFVQIEDGRIISAKGLPYASVDLQCVQLPAGAVGFISHKLDFLHLLAAFQDRDATQEEVVISWIKKSHLKGFTKLFSVFMPSLSVMICKNGSYDLMTDPNCKPGLSGLARWDAQKPIAQWTPPVLE